MLVTEKIDGIIERHQMRARLRIKHIDQRERSPDEFTHLFYCLLSIAPPEFFKKFPKYATITVLDLACGDAGLMFASVLTLVEIANVVYGKKLVLHYEGADIRPDALSSSTLFSDIFELTKTKETTAAFHNLDLSKPENYRYLPSSADIIILRHPEFFDNPILFGSLFTHAVTHFLKPDGRVFVSVKSEVERNLLSHLPGITEIRHIQGAINVSNKPGQYQDYCVAHWHSTFISFNKFLTLFLEHGINMVIKNFLPAMTKHGILPEDAKATLELIVSSPDMLRAIFCNSRSIPRHPR